MDRAGYAFTVLSVLFCIYLITAACWSRRQHLRNPGRTKLLPGRRDAR